LLKDGLGRATLERSRGMRRGDTTLAVEREKPLEIARNPKVVTGVIPGRAAGGVRRRSRGNRHGRHQSRGGKPVFVDSCYLKRRRGEEAYERRSGTAWSSLLGGAGKEPAQRGVVIGAVNPKRDIQHPADRQGCAREAKTSKADGENRKGQGRMGECQASS
jgi:hypothetical protein